RRTGRGAHLRLGLGGTARHHRLRDRVRHLDQSGAAPLRRRGMNFDEVGGVRVGHWTNETAQTGCTVVLLPEGTVASGEVRGGAPAAREFALLDPARTVQRIDAVVLTGGSAYGLSTADGVMRFCEERGIGFP